MSENSADLLADSLELLKIFRTIDDGALRRTIIDMTYALRPADDNDAKASKTGRRTSPGQPSRRT